ncbi:uncharacterized protein C14orf119 homolog [Entelurus aequoreus]|uniref:uncharacterized protein C14orf119 homolog n=1 Tax=Entelurus aequoreus TaxID=161455 RepID=UPI002B1E720A|nr:uncharacterized protein C14orf119 homolog [Entelurus aequoreus]
MSWFNHVTPSPDQRRSGVRPAPAEASPTMAAQNRAGCVAPPGLEVFPSVPRGACPPTLENLTCGSGAGQVREPEPISYVSLQEQRCVLSWFQGWGAPQRERFLQDLVGKAVPGKVCTLLDSLSTLQVKDRLPNIFECQLRLWTQWFESWGEEERNHFLHILEERDPTFVAHFYGCVAGTAGRD